MDYKKLCELIEVRNRQLELIGVRNRPLERNGQLEWLKGQLELFKVAKETEFPEGFPEHVRRELDFLETELERIILELADEIQKNHQPTQALTAESKFLDLKTVKHFVEKRKLKAAEKIGKPAQDLVESCADYCIGLTKTTMSNYSKTEKDKNGSVFVIWAMVDSYLDYLCELEGAEKNAKH